MRKVILAAIFFAFNSPLYAANLYISEYSNLASASATVAQIAGEPVIVDQGPISYSGGAALSATLNATTGFVRLICDTQCSVKFGTAPTATNANKVLPALTPEYFGVSPGSNLKISVISNP